MSIFSDFVNSDVPHIGTMFSFEEIHRFVINSLTISQNFISISFFVQKLLQKTFGGGSLNPPSWRVRVNFKCRPIATWHLLA